MIKLCLPTEETYNLKKQWT